MTSKTLYEKMKPNSTRYYTAQLLQDGLNLNMSDIFTKLIRDAARCNHYSSDVFYDMKIIESAMQDFDPEKEFEPIWVGFRKLGVDSNGFILSRMDNEFMYGPLSQNYFALYSLTVEPKESGFYNVVFNEYNV